jgi:hypothetical protein
MTRRGLAIGSGIASTALLAAAALAVAFVPMGRSDEQGSKSPTTAKPLPSASNEQPAGSRGVVPPATGAYLGAWVQPMQFTERGRLAAKEEFEADVGRELDIVHDFHKWADEFPSEFDHDIARSGAIPLISWGGTDTRLIAIGDEDELIRQRARSVKEFGTPILLRWRWEMERPNLRAEVHSPADYIAAWKRIRAIFTVEGVTNASFVWCPLAEGFDSGRAQAFYPGDDQVDWLCTDAYTLDPREPLSRVMGKFLDWARPRGKPIVIGEFGTLPGKPGARAGWLAELPDIVRKNPQIKGFVYFDSDTEQRGVTRQWSLRWDPRDVAAFSALAKDRLFNVRKLSVASR